MEGRLLPNLLVFLLFTIKPVFSEVVVTIGDRIAFPSTKDCMQSGARLVHRLLDNSERRVADFRDVWRPGPGYDDRMSPGESVILQSANVNDNGLYELICGSGEEIRIQVQVVPASRVSVAEGEDVALSFHHISLGVGGAAAYARCDRNGELLFEVDLSSEAITYGAGLESRVSVSSSWKTRGDFSPTLRRAQVRDGGDYFFYALDKAKKKTRESPVAVRVEVKTNQSDPTTEPPPPVCGSTEGGMETGAFVSVAVAVAAVLLGFGLGWFLKPYKSSAAPCSGSEVPAQSVAMGLLTG